MGLGEATAPLLLRCPLETKEKPMPVTSMSLIERIAHILAARDLSINAGGGDPSAADRVNAASRHHLAVALSGLCHFREPATILTAAGTGPLCGLLVGLALQPSDPGPAPRTISTSR